MLPRLHAPSCTPKEIAQAKGMSAWCIRLSSSDEEQEVRHIPEGVDFSHLCPLLTRGVVAHSTASDMRPRRRGTGTPPRFKNRALLAKRERSSTGKA